MKSLLSDVRSQQKIDSLIKFGFWVFGVVTVVGMIIFVASGKTIIG